MPSCTDTKVELAEGLLSLQATAGGKSYKLENMPLGGTIEPDESKWSCNDRAVIISLKKKEAEWWDVLTKEKAYKRFVKVDFAKWCEEEDKEYTGEPSLGGDFDSMGGGIGGGGMDLSSMMSGMGGMNMGGGDGMDFADAGGDDSDDDDPSTAPPLASDPAPPLEGDDDKPPPLEVD